MTAQVFRFSDYDQRRSAEVSTRDPDEPCLVVILPSVPEERLQFNPTTGMIELMPVNTIWT